MLSTAQRQTAIAAIRRLPDELEALIAELSDEQLHAQTLPDEWTVQQIVHHLADSHMNSFLRLKHILTSERPTLQPYDQEIWAETPEIAITPVSASIALLRGLHTRWCLLFEQLDEAQWARLGWHPEYGEITPDGLVTAYADHGANHLEQIRRVIAALPSAAR
jgi:hypothetical protein